jgi:prolyl oligopeptidase
VRLISTILLAALTAGPVLAADAPLTYPAAPRVDVTENFFGTTVGDPYHWMEDVDSPQTVAWAKAENALTHGYLDAIPARPAIAAAFRKLYDYEKVSAPFRAGKRWFYFHNSGLQTQSALFVRDSETGPARLFFDPNTLSADGKEQMANLSFTRDGSLMAYATQSGGADWYTWHVKSVATGRDLPDVIHWSKFSGADWAGNRGFYYAGYDAPSAKNQTLAKLDVQKVWFHALGTPQSADRLVYASTAHPDEFVGVEVSHDQRYTFLERSKGDGNALAWKPRDEPGNRFRPIFSLDPNVSYGILGNDGSRIFVQTNLHAPRFRIAAFDLNDPSHALRDVVPETADKLDGAELVGDRFYLSYLHDAHSVVGLASVTGRPLGTIALPAIGTASFGQSHREDRAVYYTFESFAYPPVTYRYDPVTATQTVVFRSPIAFDPTPFVTEQLFATSKDGTRVPVFVIHRKDIPLDGSTPTILYGYGGFDISITPYFAKETALWLQMGGAYAVATLRGGGEYGDAWHDAGRLANKQHVFDDFIASAQMLIERKITSTPKLAVNGGSNGGLLVGAVLTQRPDLFGAAIAEQGVLDMLRFERFTVGKAWIPEYGSARASAEQFRTLYAYSPLDNVKPGTHYPPTLITTADHDDRVYPSHSFKFAAALQNAQAGDAPILLRVETNEGHFSGLTTDKSIAITADFYAFLVKSLDFTPTL